MINELYADKIKDAEINLELADKELELIKLETEESKTKNGIEEWLGYRFESSTTKTLEYSLFERQIKSYIKKQLDQDLELVAWNKMYFEFSGFIKNKRTGRFVYFSCPDVRFYPDWWYNDLLIRTAENERDFTGGSNDWCKLPGLSKKAKELTK